MKHLIETTDLSSLGFAEYDRLILDSTKNEIVYRGGVNTNGHSYVDLGLQSGTLWATMNVGAKTETDYGDYFMWGSTTPNTNTTCDWTNAPLNNGSSDYDSNYFNTHKSEWLDDNNNLKPEYDAARAIMGGDWRMPTKADFDELLDNTGKKWTQVNGVYGYKFTGSNGNSIFIPAAGLRSNSSFHYQGSFDLVWSSSLNPSSPDRAWMLYSTSDLVYMNNRNHNLGFVVRGVFK